ncbi:MAG: hypothetical protein J6D54_00895 [Olsenella sp.]|nr:hypothetical protein [Olsenella sp.]
MGFARALNDCCGQLGCSNRELAECSGLSASSFSRYRSAGRTPEDERTVRAIAHGVATIARARGVTLLSDEQDVFEMLLSSLNEGSEARRSFCVRLDALMGSLSISNADMARHANVDPSYLSRIRGGQRTPSDVELYASSFASLAARRAVEQGLGAEVEGLLGPDASDAGRPISQIDDVGEVSAMLRTWLLSGHAPAEGSGAERFLSYLDDFDLNEYVADARFDSLKIPVSPIVVPRSRSYYGLSEMRAAELEFLKTTATARATGEVILYSNMPMATMGSDDSFVRRYVVGIGALIKRGMRLSVVHDLNRPFDEMMMGLEGYIPLYMTGQISPFWLDGVPDTPFCQLINSSEVAMLEAECIRDHHTDGRYRFSTRREDVEYARRRARQVLEHASPLMEIYRSDDPARLGRFEAAERERRSRGTGVRVGEGAFRNLLIWSYPEGVVVISKTNDPVMHFEIRNPRLCRAIADFSPSVLGGASGASRHHQ